MLIGYMRVSSSDERQVVDLQLDTCSQPGSMNAIYTYELEGRRETCSPAEDRSAPCRETPKFCDSALGGPDHKGEGCRKNLSLNKNILR